ncbi:hypothetical protein ACFX2H_015255 [Malus domestica]
MGNCEVGFSGIQKLMLLEFCRPSPMNTLSQCSQVLRPSLPLPFAEKPRLTCIGVSSSDLVWSMVEGWRDKKGRVSLIPFPRVDDFLVAEVRNHIVCRAVNPATRVLEYTVHDLADGVKVSEPGKKIVAQSFQLATLFPGVEELMYTMMCFIEFKRGLPPVEVVVMPLHVTIGELKRVAESALGDTYSHGNRKLG